MKVGKMITLAGATLTLAVGSVLFLNSCQTLPKGAIPVQNFDAERYLGKWYEIARFDFRFEKDMNNTTANYSMNNDGTIKVVNRGYNYVTNEWKEATGKAKFTLDPTVAKLKVSFFGPFYAPYNVIELDANYQYALVVGKNTKYMWILARKKNIPEEIKKRYVEKVKSLGFDVNQLIWVKHNS